MSVYLATNLSLSLFESVKVKPNLLSGIKLQFEVISNKLLPIFKQNAGRQQERYKLTKNHSVIHMINEKK